MNRGILTLALAWLAVLLTSCTPPDILMAQSRPPGYTRVDIPDRYRGLRNPFSPEDRQALEAGRALYQTHCQRCHGESGRGDGPMADFLEPRPANFSAPNLVRALREQHDYIFWRVSEGVPQTAMPAFRNILGEEERWQAITYARHLGERSAAAGSEEDDRGTRRRYPFLTPPPEQGVKAR